MPPETIDSLDAGSLKPLVLSLLARIEELLAQNKTLLARIAELEARAGKPPKTPTNSSLPPSSGQKANVADAPRPKQSRKGRPGVARALCPSPDVTRNVFAERCCCGSKLSPADQVLAHAWDHVDLPPIKPITTRINLHRGVCACCKKGVTAAPPADMPPGSPFGPGIVAAVTYLHGCQISSEYAEHSADEWAAASRDFDESARPRGWRARPEPKVCRSRNVVPAGPY